MIQTVIPTVLVVALTACGGGSGGGDLPTTPAATVAPTLTASVNPSFTVAAAIGDNINFIGQYRNEIGSMTYVNSTVADINGDGLDDIVVSSWAGGPAYPVSARSGFTHLRLLIQQQNGSLKDLTDNFIENAEVWGSQRTIVMDFDNDGRPDIALMGFQDGPNAAPAPSVIFWNNGSKFVRQDLPEKVAAHAACAGDLTGDGLPEIVVGESGNHSNTIYKNYGGRKMAFDKALTSQRISSWGACAVVKDHNHGTVAVVTTNLVWNKGFSAVAHVWDRNFNFVRTVSLPGSEESILTNSPDLVNDIVNVIPIDINRDGLMDIVLTNNGDWKIPDYKGYLTVLINQGNFEFVDETARYLPNQSKTTFFNYYYNTLTLDGYPAFFVDNGADGVTMWQIRNGVFTKYNHDLLNKLVQGYKANNVYRTSQGLSLFLTDENDYPFTNFYYRPIPRN